MRFGCIGTARLVAAASSVHGKSPELVAHVGEHRLQLHRRGVVRGAVDLALLARGGDVVAARVADDVEVIDVREAVGDGGAHDLVRQVLVVPLGHQRAAAVPLVDDSELDAQDRRLKLVETRVEADVGERLLVLAAVEAELAGALDEHLAVAGDQAAVAVAAEVLGGEEAEDAHVAEAAGATADVGRAPRLAGVLDDRRGRAASATLRMASMSQGRPKRSTGMIALVRGVIAALMASGSMFRACPAGCRRTRAWRRPARWPRAWRRT